MAYSGRHRYKSRREKFEKSRRNIRLVILFGLLAAVILIYRNWQDIYTWWIIQFG